MISLATRLGRHGTSKRVRRISRLELILLFGILILPLVPELTRVVAHSAAMLESTTNAKPVGRTLARLGESLSVRAAGRGNPTINLSDGRTIVVSYAGPLELQQALENNKAEPLSLTAADFDEDGVADLIFCDGDGMHRL